MHYLDFCEDFRVCPFTVVIFPHNLRNVGDVRQLEGRIIEVHGPIKEYDGRAEIIVEESRQLQGAGAKIPPLPKNYDVEKQGHYSAGSIYRTKASNKKSSKRVPATLPVDISSDQGPVKDSDSIEDPAAPH